MNDRRGHNDSRHHRRRFRHHSSTCCPHAGRSLTRTSGRSFTAADSTPQAGHGPSRAACSMITFTAAGPVRSTLRTPNSASSPNNTAAGSDNIRRVGQHLEDNSSSSIRHARGLAAGRCERPTACRGHEPNTGYDTSAQPSGYPAKDRRASNHLSVLLTHRAQSSFRRGATAKAKKVGAQ